MKTILGFCQQSGRLETSSLFSPFEKMVIALNIDAYNNFSPPEGRAVCKTYFSFLLVYVILILGIYFFFQRHT